MNSDLKMWTKLELSPSPMPKGTGAMLYFLFAQNCLCFDKSRLFFCITNWRFSEPEKRATPDVLYFKVMNKINEMKWNEVKYQ